MRYFLLFTFCVLSLGCHAADAPQNDNIAIENTIQLLFTSLAKDDFETAFSMNTNEARDRLRTVDQFKHAVKNSYTALWRNEERHIAEITSQGGGFATVAMIITDKGGDVFVAMFEMVFRDAWMINSCKLIQSKAKRI